MRRCLRLLGLLVLLLHWGSIPVYAATAVDVTITANPGGMFAPTDFIATYINDKKITLTWTSNPTAVATIIRAKVGSYPTGIGDGYLVYSGAGDTVDDTAVSLDETATNIYYSAWSTDGAGNFSPDYAQTNAGGIGMTLIAFTLVPLALITLFLVFHVGLLSFAAALAWGVLGFFSYQSSAYSDSGIWDVYYGFFWLCIGMVIACVFLPSVMRPKPAAEIDDVYVDDIDRVEAEQAKTFAGTRIPRLGRRAYRGVKRDRRNAR